MSNDTLHNIPWKLYFIPDYLVRILLQLATKLSFYFEKL